MYRKFIAAISAASLTISLFAGAAPARADGDDLAKILAGIAVIAIIGKAIDDRNDRKHGHVSRNSKGHGQVYAPAPRRHPQAKPRSVPQRFARYDLPGQCLVTLNTGRNGQMRMFGKRCLRSNYQHFHALPQVCAQEIWTERGVRRGYSPRCLRQNGYRIAGRR